MCMCIYQQIIIKFRIKCRAACEEKKKKNKTLSIVLHSKDTQPCLLFFRAGPDFTAMKLHTIHLKHQYRHLLMSTFLLECYIKYNFYNFSI